MSSDSSHHRRDVLRVSWAGAFEAGGLKETLMFLPHPLVKLSIAGNLCDREVACSASDLQDLNFESCVWRAVSPYSSHHPQQVPLAELSLYVHKSGVKPDSFHFIFSGSRLVCKYTKVA